eukprot:gene4191-4499_t
MRTTQIIIVALGLESVASRPRDVPPPPPSCRSNLDCELLGQCQSGVCKCYPGFTGPTCGRLDLLPITQTSPQPGRVWPVSTDPYYPPASNHTSIGWSFAPVWDPVAQQYVGAIESVCDKWGTAVWIAAVAAPSPAGPWRFQRRLGPYGTNCPHLTRLPNGTFSLIFNSHPSSMYPANATAPGDPPVCVGSDTAPPAQAMAPAWRPCGADESPSKDHDCLCSRASKSCPDCVSGTYLATTDAWPDGPWRIAPVKISGPGWAPYNSTLSSIGTSNPTMVLLKSGKSLLAMRSHAGYWPGVTGEHTGFAMADSIEGPYSVVGNLSWQYGNDEDPFVWQQPDGTLHCLYHNGRTTRHPNHGLHAFSADGLSWHKPYDALQLPCASPNGTHACTALYNNTIAFHDGTKIDLAGRERPALIFDPGTGAPTWLFNGAISVDTTVPWFAMAQPINSGR